MRTRVLVTGAGGPAGTALVRELRARGQHVLAVDAEHHPGVVRVPYATDPGLVAVLRRLVDLEQIDLVIPTVSEELPVLAASMAQLNPAHTVVAPERAVRLAHDKLLTCQVLESAGVPVPAFGVPEDYDDARAAVRALGGAVVTKPRVSRGGRGVEVVDEAWTGSWAEVPPGSVVQAFAPGVEYAPMVFRAPGADRAQVTVVLEKTALADGRVGNATAVRRVRADDVAEVASRAVVALGLTGPVDLDVRRDVDGRPVVLEVNARFGANSAAAPEVIDAVLEDSGLPAHGAGVGA
ncbi:ATP-grasp domain-containing protein [Isoptericola halotolerans]|uniref:ATP-grasp domain-containing protein n=1 Tax=Isoptericola halotolerans TaxID=300560 RepID=UPI00389028E6